jgi:hypothetical protein
MKWAGHLNALFNRPVPSKYDIHFRKFCIEGKFTPATLTIPSPHHRKHQVTHRPHPYTTSHKAPAKVSTCRTKAPSHDPVSVHLSIKTEPSKEQCNPSTTKVRKSQTGVRSTYRLTKAEQFMDVLLLGT